MGMLNFQKKKFKNFLQKKTQEVLASWVKGWAQREPKPSHNKIKWDSYFIRDAVFLQHLQ